MARSARSAEVARTLGVSSATIQRYARDGLIPFATTAGGHRRFDVDEVRTALHLPEPELTVGARPGTGRRSCTAVILTALGLEMQAVLGLLPSRQSRRLRSGTRYEEGSLAGQAIDWTIHVAEIGPGNNGAATEATAAIHELAPDIVLFVGVAGSLKPEITHGSVVVASKVYSYLSGKSTDEFRPRPVVYPTWHGLSQLVLMVRRRRWADFEPQPSVWHAPIAAGERVVASQASEDFRILREQYSDAAAIDMESVGLYLAADRERLPAIAVRGISDMVADKAAIADAHWQPIAARNAAAFAFALLGSVDPSDLGLGPSPSPYPSERLELLGSLPPPAADAIERAADAVGESSLTLLRLLANWERSPTEIVADAIAGSSPIAGTSDQFLWVAVGEYSLAHDETRAAATAFGRAAATGRSEAPRWHARAAMARAAGGEMDLATAELRAAREAALGSDPFLDVIEAAIAEDAGRIIEVAKSQHLEEPLVDLMLVKALEVTGSLDEAIDVARTSLERAPNRAMTGGLALAAAKLLLRRAQEAPESTITTRDLQEAQELALLVRDLRRSWRGPSSEAAWVAAVAAFEGGDREGALRIALPGPDGSATAREASDPELLKAAASFAMALRHFDQARALAARITDSVDRLLVEVDCDIGEGKATEETSRRLAEAIPGAEGGARFRAFLQLAELGVSPLPDLALLEDPDGKEIVVAEAEIKVGRHADGIRRLRALSSPRSHVFLVKAYVDAGLISEAVDALRDGAQRFGEPRNLLHAAVLLLRAGQLEQARAEAERALAIVPSRSHLGGESRLLLIEVHSRLRQWSAVATHAKAAVDDGFDADDVRWALVWAEFSRRDHDAALRAWRSRALRPRNDDEAILVTQLLRVPPHNERVVVELLDLAEGFQDSEQVCAAAFAALLEVSRELKLSDDEVTRLDALSAAFFERWPASALLRRVDASDINTVVEYLRETLSPSARQTEEVAQQVQQGDLPYGLLAATVGRSLAETLLKDAAGGIAAGQPDPDLAAREDRAALLSLDKVAVADTAALVVVDRTGIDPRSILAAFSRVLVPSVILDDAFVAADALRLRSTSTMGWDPRQDRPVITEIEPAVADQWARAAEGLLDRIRGCQITEVRAVNSRRDLAIEVMLAPVRLAQELDVPMWSDDRAMRSLALNEGVESFGTLSILRAWASAGRVDSIELEHALLALLRRSVVDFDVSGDLVRRLAAEEEWRGGHAALVLSRPAFWVQPEPGLTVYKEALAEAATRNPTALPQWAFAAALGVARRRPAAQRGDVIAGLLLIGFLALGLAPEPLPHLLAGARAAADLLGSGDPLIPVARMLATSLREQFAADLTGKLFTRAISNLAPEDRAVAFGAFVQRA